MSSPRPRPDHVYHRDLGADIPAALPRSAWMARAVDAGIIIVLTIAVAFGMAHSPTGLRAGGFIAGLFVGSGLGAVVLGGLYGLGVSPGQLIAGVKARRTLNGKRIGAIRGIARYFGVAWMPLWVVFLLGMLFSGDGGPPSFWDDDVVVTVR